MQDLNNIILANKLAGCESLEQIEGFINDRLSGDIQQEISKEYQELTGRRVADNTLDVLYSSDGYSSDTSGAYGYSAGEE